MRWAVVLAVLMSTGVSVAQMSPEEAAKRLHERQAAREAEKNKLVQIKEGDLEAMKAEIESLKKEVARLQAKLGGVTQNPANADAPVVVDPSDPVHVKQSPSFKFSTSIDIGATRQQLLTFMTLHRHFRIAKDVKSPADHQEIMTVELWFSDEVYTGESSNGVDTFRNYKKQRTALGTTEVVLVNDVIAQMSGDKIDLNGELGAKHEEDLAEARKDMGSTGRPGRARRG